MRWLAFLVLATTAACARDLSTDNFNHPFDPWVPRDVRAFIIDAQACQHFSGESGEGMPERQAYIDKMMLETCANIEQRKRVLMERHRSERVRQLISEVWD